MTDTDLLQQGQAALNAENYAEAIGYLEACCNTSEPRSNIYLKSQMGLVRAYQRTQQSEKAIALCHELAQHPNPKLQAWANQALQDCPPVRNLLSPEAAQSLFEQANKAIRLRRYSEALPLLEQFCQQTDASYSNHYQAKTLLVKAYQNTDGMENAIALCQELLEVEHNVTQIWARNYFPVLAPEIAQAILNPEEPTEVEEEKPVNLSKRTLEEFKDFCRQNLMADLREVEKTRNEILRPLAIVTVIFMIVVGGILTYTPTLLNSTIESTQKRCEAPVETVMKFRDGTVRQNVKAVDLDQLERSSSRRCRSNFVPRSTQDGMKILSLALSLIGIASFLWVAFYTSSTETYGRGFQRNIIEKIVRFLDPTEALTYSRAGDEYVIISSLNQSRLFSGVEQSVYLKHDHCVTGRFGKTNLFFSEVTFQKEMPHGWLGDTYSIICAFGRSTGSVFSISIVVFLLLSLIRGGPYCIGRMLKGQRINFEHFRSEIVLNSVSRQSIFKGIFFTSDFNRKFRGRTVILPNKFSSTLKFLNHQRGQAVKLEDPEFNQFFSVYSNDQVGARYVLSTAIMQRIVEFRKKANRDILISLVDSQLYIALPSEEDLFEPRLFKSMLNFQPMREYFEVLQLMMSIAEDLNLNQRIWKV